MKIVVKALFIIGAFSITACRDRAVEKRLADIESRLALLEGSSAKPVPQLKPGITPVASGTPETKPEGPLPEIQFDSDNHDFGVVKEGPKVSHIYKVKNTGKAPLIIQDVKPTCGCTTPDWTRTPIPVGADGFIKAEFDTKGRPGMNNKTISVIANTWPKTTTLKFKAMVTPSQNSDNGPKK